MRPPITYSFVVEDPTGTWRGPSSHCLSPILLPAEPEKLKRNLFIVFPAGAWLGPSRGRERLSAELTYRHSFIANPAWQTYLFLKTVGSL